MELPIELQGLLALAIGSLVTAVLTQLLKLGFDFSGYQSQIVASLVAAVLVVINAVFAKIPADFVGIANALLQFIVVVLGAFGAYAVWKQAKK